MKIIESLLGEDEVKQAIKNTPNDIRRKTFYPNACHLCKDFGVKLNSTIKRCSGCGLISYCTKEHQAADWPQHKEICKIINKIRNKSSSIFTLMKENDVIDKIEWLRMRLSLVKWISCKLDRKLEKFEQQMFLYPRNCLVCHDTDPAVLVDCQKCPGYSFCQRHINNDDNHECDKMSLCQYLDVHSNILLSHNSSGKIPEYFNTTFNLSSSVDQFLKQSNKSIKTDEQQPVMDNVRTYLHAANTDELTGPLTLLYGLGKLNYKFTNQLLIHVIGATMRDVQSLWEILFHHHESRILDVVQMVFVGRDLPETQQYDYNCVECKKRNVRIEYKRESSSYREFVDSKRYTKPDVVVGYNLSVHEHKKFGVNQQSWLSLCEALSRQICPFILTSHTLERAQEDHDRILKATNKLTKQFQDTNPFGSLRPYRDYETELLYFPNQYITVYTLN